MAAGPGALRSNTGMIYVSCPPAPCALHAALVPAIDFGDQTPVPAVICLPHMCGRRRSKVREMKMTRPDLIVLSICGGFRQDVWARKVCLSVYLSVGTTFRLSNPPPLFSFCFWVINLCLRSLLSWAFDQIHNCLGSVPQAIATVV